MSVLKTIFYVLLILLTPVLSVFLIRLAMKGAKAVDRLAKTLDDARPQLNILLMDLHRSLDEAETQLAGMSEIAGRAQETMQRVEAGATSFQKALGSPLVRYAGVLAAFVVSSWLFRGRFSGGRGRR